MNFNVYRGTIKLTKLIDARIINEEDDNGILERGIFIPIDKNGLYVKNEDVFLTMFFFPTIKYSMRGVCHFIAQYVSASHYDKLKSLGYRTPLLGYLKFFNNSKWSEYFKKKSAEAALPVKRQQIKYIQIDEK